jgi:hypothetical protein
MSEQYHQSEIIQKENSSDGRMCFRFKAFSNIGRFEN